MTDAYFESRVDSVIERRGAEFDAEMAELPPLDDLPEVDHPTTG
jgi:hypothetical protein